MRRVTLIFLLIFFIGTNETLASYSEVAAQYDLDYQGGGVSMYNKRFGKDKVIVREKDLIVECYQKIIAQNKDLQVVRILDFGCGDGRMLPVIEYLAESNSGIKLELIAHDISIVALQSFAEQLAQSSYQRVAKDRWIKNNLTIILLMDINNDVIAKQPVHLVLSIFSVFGHVGGRDARQKLLRKLINFIEDGGFVLVTVSTIKSLPQEVAAYDLLRNQYSVAVKYRQRDLANSFKCTLREARESGDMYYTKDDGKISTNNFGHVYTADELAEDFKISGVKMVSRGVISIEQPYVLSHSWFRQYCDKVLSLILSWDINIYPFNQADTMAKNIFAIGYKKN